MRELNALPLPELYARLATNGLTRRLIELARDEDLGPDGADLTGAVALRPSDRLRVTLVTRTPCTLAGLAAIPELIQTFGGGIVYEPIEADGRAVNAGAPLARLAGPARTIVALERTLLNLVARLSGVATLTARYAAETKRGAEQAGLDPDTIAVYDTRKTTPGLRVFEKYAVRCGGGRVHRLGLHDAVLVKDNHLAPIPLERLGAHVAELSAAARRAAPNARFIEIEVDTLDQLRAITPLPPGTIDLVLLDNMAPDRLREAARWRDAHAPHLGLEASGGVRLETIAEIAATGVDRISAGALTHSAASADLAFDAD